MSQLSQLLDPTRRPAVVADLARFAETTAAAQSGITGMALKGALGAGKKVDADIVSKAVGRILPDILTHLEPAWQEYEASNSDDFGIFLAPRAGQVTDSILSAADEQANKVSVAALVKAYSSLRGKLAKIIEANVPELGRILQRHM